MLWKPWLHDKHACWMINIWLIFYVKSSSVEFFRNSLEYKNVNFANFANFMLASV